MIRIKFIMIMVSRSRKKYEAIYLGNRINRQINIKYEALNKMQKKTPNLVQINNVLENLKCKSKVATYHF